MPQDGQLSLMLVSTWLSHAGAETQVKELACEHARRGARVMVVSLRRPEAFVEELRAAGVEVVSLDMTPGVPDIKGIVRLAREIRRFKPDVVHSHMVHANLLARVTRVFCKMRVLVCTAHNISEGGRWRELAYGLTDSLADVTTNVSRAALDRYVQIGAVSRGKARLVPNGIDIDRFAVPSASRDAMRGSLNLGDEFVFLAALRLERVKGVDVLLEAVAVVRRQEPGVRLIIAGEGSLRAELERVASSLGLDDGTVRFIGLRADVSQLMSACDTLVLPSRWEGLPMVLLEAAALGLPIVATDVGGNTEIVKDGENGFVVPADDAGALAKAMLRMLRFTPAVRGRMGERGRSLVCRQYSLKAVVDTWEELYQEYLNKRRVRRGSGGDPSRGDV